MTGAGTIAGESWGAGATEDGLVEVFVGCRGSKAAVTIFLILFCLPMSFHYF